MIYRSILCGEVSNELLGKEIILSGWVHKVRDKGKLIWIDLRDISGLVQLVLEEDKISSTVFQYGKKIGREYVIKVKGLVRKKEIANPNLPTGEFELLISELEILNSAKNIPFTIEDQTDGGVDLRMKYRYLDLRRNLLKNNLLLKSKVIRASREFLEENSFLEIETPYLVKSTPEGARDYVVPSRQFPNQYYALPQSPQLFKQLLMIGGMDRYFQIVKCFRDEDLRADRQPEFSQIDCEMSFVDQFDVMNMFEKFIKFIFKKVKNITLPPIKKMTYNDAMNFYGSDKPDLRYDMKFVHISDIAKLSKLNDFQNAEIAVCLCAKDCGNISRSEIEKLQDELSRNLPKQLKLFTIKVLENLQIKTSLSKFFDEHQLHQIVSKACGEFGDMIFILAGEREHTLTMLGNLRKKIAQKKNIIQKDQFELLWVVDFPLLEWNEEENRLTAKHHPFTAPNIEDLNNGMFDLDPKKIRAQAYDLVINGLEIGGGSIRISSKELQMKMLNVLGFDEQQAQSSFGFLLEALEYGAPPHGGIAFGLDRLCAVLAGEESIRSFIAFPKNNSGRDVMIEAPSFL